MTVASERRADAAREQRVGWECVRAGDFVFTVRASSARAAREHGASIRAQAPNAVATRPISIRPTCCTTLAQSLLFRQGRIVLEVL